MRLVVVHAIAIVMLFFLTACLSEGEINSRQDMVEMFVSAEESSPINETEEEGHINCEESEGDDVPQESEKEKPTGYPKDEIQAELIFVNERLYVNAPIYVGDDNWGNGGLLPKGYEWFGEIAHIENKEEPDQDFEATHVEIGAEIYVNISEPGYIYVKYPALENYWQFTLASEVEAWWR